MKKHPLLPARDAAWLTETLNRRLGRTGLRMMADDPQDPPADPPEDPPADDGKGSKSAVLADLAKERRARQALEQQVADLAPLKEQMTALAAAFGVKPNGSDTDSDVLTVVQEQLAQIKRDNAVLAAANECGITDSADIDLLKSSALEGEALAAMAERLKPTEDPKGTPKPDLSQGSKGGDSKPEALPGVPRLAQAFEDAFNDN